MWRRGPILLGSPSPIRPPVVPAMKGLSVLFWIGIFVGSVFVSYKIVGRSETKIQYTVAASEQADRMAIQRLFERYYAGLRAGKYDEVAQLYSPEAAKIMGGRQKLAQALRGATELLGIPKRTSLHGIRFDGDTALGEVILPGGDSSGQYEYSENGKVIGTWAKTLHFVRAGDSWLISEKSENTAGVDPGEALKLLETLTKKK